MFRLLKMREDGLYDFLRREGVNRHGMMRHAIEREAFFVASTEIGGVGEDGADGFCAAAAGEGGFERGFEMDETCGGVGE
jgi:hypothetical protein